MAETCHETHTQFPKLNNGMWTSFNIYQNMTNTILFRQFGQTGNKSSFGGTLQVSIESIHCPIEQTGQI